MQGAGMKIKGRGDVGKGSSLNGRSKSRRKWM